MSDQIRVRALAEADLDAVKAIAAGLPDAPHWERSAYRAAITRAGTRQGIALAAEGSDSGLAGFVIGGIVAPEAEIESIAVRSDLHRRGIARQLLNAFSAEAQRLACSMILLEVRPSNAPALAFYQSLGFNETARRPAYYRHPLEDAILMARALP